MKVTSIGQIDKNLQVVSQLDEKDIVFLNVKDDPFRVYGLYNYKHEKVFKRMPDEIVGNINEGVKELNYGTAGGRVRFSTDSKYVAIKCTLPSVEIMPHMPLSGSAGFDIYIDEGGKSTYYKTFMPPVEIKDGYESVVHFESRKMRSLTINFPLYTKVDSLFIGLQEDASVGRGEEYLYKKPVVYYGSSITQGGCASRPGNAYESIISRWLNCDHINLGFSGSARGEPAIAEYIAKLNMNVFVFDYDHNAPDVTHLDKTHKNFYNILRAHNAYLPIICLSKPDFEADVEGNTTRRNVIYETYRSAVNSGDKNIYFIDGETLFGDIGRDSCTVDGCHPNDLGFMRMAEAIYPVLKKLVSA